MQHPGSASTYHNSLPTPAQLYVLIIGHHYSSLPSLLIIAIITIIAKFIHNIRNKY
jgi:hypothetical protein